MSWSPENLTLIICQLASKRRKQNNNTECATDLIAHLYLLQLTLCVDTCAPAPNANRKARVGERRSPSKTETHALTTFDNEKCNSKCGAQSTVKEIQLKQQQQQRKKCGKIYIFSDPYHVSSSLTIRRQNRHHNQVPLTFRLCAFIQLTRPTTTVRTTKTTLNRRKNAGTHTLTRARAR